MARAQLCPFCFREFDLDEVQWRCLHPACTSPESGRPLEVDQAYTDFLAEATGTPQGPQQLKHSFGPIPRRKRLGGLLHTKDARVAYCDWCNNVTERRLCPSCHNELPYTIDSMSMHIVAIVGAAASIPPAIVKALARVRWFRLVPEHLHFIDNSQGFGHRDEIDLTGK